MKAAGFVYVPINPSMQGLLKIGKTERSSEQRARELSVASDAFFRCVRGTLRRLRSDRAPIHALLEERGCRVTPSREFFSLELKEAVRAVSDAKDILGRESLGGPQPSGARVPTHTDFDSAVVTGGDDPWQDVLDQAEDAYHGNGESFQYYEEAFRLYDARQVLGVKGGSVISREVWMDIKMLSRQGMSIRAIARHTGHSRTTVRKTLSETVPKSYGPRSPRATKLTPWLAGLGQSLDQRPYGPRRGPAKRSSTGDMRAATSR